MPLNTDGVVSKASDMRQRSRPTILHMRSEDVQRGSDDGAMAASVCHGGRPVASICCSRAVISAGRSLREFRNRKSYVLVDR